MLANMFLPFSPREALYHGQVLPHSHEKLPVGDCQTDTDNRRLDGNLAVEDLQLNGCDLLECGIGKSNVRGGTIRGGCETSMTPSGTAGVAGRRGSGN
jgi:hypothetical protein